jgi:hypothetical protein
MASLTMLAPLVRAAGAGAKPISVAERIAEAEPMGGVVPDLPTGASVHLGPLARTADLPYGGGPVLHSNRTHLIFWAPAGSGLAFDPGYESLIEEFLAAVAADSHKSSSVYGLTGRYRDPGGPAAYASSYAGAMIDNDRLPASRCTEPRTGPRWSVCLTDEQLENEVTRLVGGDHLQQNPRPNGSTADPAISSLSHEHSETITDPEGDAWIDAEGDEDGDLRASQFGPDLGGTGARAYNEVIHGGHYYMQEEWSNHDHSCQQRALGDQAFFMAPARAPAHRRVWFSASAHAGDGAIVAYHWYFGDGGSGHRRLGSHTFGRAGLYRVVLRTVDSWGNWAYYASELLVTPG